VAPGEAKVAGLYVICGIEKDRALKAGFDDALMLDWQGRLAESTGANIFLTTAGKLVTPKPENFLDGITRRAVMSMAARRGWAVDERAVMPEELAEASEVFLCGTAAEIVPVGSIDERRYQVGPMTRALVDDYAKLVRQPDCEGFGESAHFTAA
jgi:branched-chain amino acid aminotransferase